MTPNAPDGLPAYLLPYLADIAKSEGLATDYRIEYKAGSKAGDGFTSQLLAVTLVGAPHSEPNADTDTPAKTGEPAEIRVPLVCKLQPVCKERQEDLANSAMFEREVFVYNRLLPLFNRMQRGRQLNEEKGGFFAVPRCHVAYMNVFEDQAFVIMQDLRARGFAMLPKQRPVGFEHAKLVLQQLGKLHGLSFVLRDQLPDVYADFMRQPNLYKPLMVSKSAQTMFESTFRRAERLLERPADKRLMAKLRTEWPAIFDNILDVKKMGDFAVFGHSDCWNNNFMFREEEGKPIELCILDWQFARPMSPADDFVMFLCSTTEKALRDEHYDEFLHIYHDSLSEIVRLCGSDPEKLFRFEDFVGTLSKYGDYGVAEAALTVSLMVAADDEETAAPETQEEGETNHYAGLNKHTEQLYKRRLEDVLDDARKYGWFSFDVEAE